MPGIEFEVLPSLSTLFREYGIEQTADNLAQFDTFMEALKVYNDRTAPYGQAWEQYGALSNLLNMARKVDRLMAVWWRGSGEDQPALHKDNLDDAIDLLNYDAFFIRNARRGNITGEAPKRPAISNHPSRFRRRQ